MPINKQHKQRLHRRVHTHVKYHYYRVMPSKKRHRTMVWVAFLLYAGIVAAQMLYPLDRALPLARFGDKYVGWQSQDKLAGMLNSQMQATRLRLKTDRKTVEYQLGTAGAELRTEAMIHTATDYPFWWRFVPFSILVQPASQDHPKVEYSPIVLKKFSAQQAKKLEIAPTSARLAIEKGKLVAQDDVSGQTVTAQTIEQAIRRKLLPFDDVVTVSIPTKAIQAPVRASDFAEVKTQAEAALARQVTITVEGKPAMIVPSTKVATWLVVGSDKKKPALKFDNKALNAYLDTIDAKVGKKSGTTNITITNGIETGRSIGKVGKVIDRSEVTSGIRDWVLNGEGTGFFTTKLVDVAPGIIYNSKYTATEAGLRAYVRDKSRQMNVHIAIKQLSGEHWTASARADESIPSASTYKLYVAKWLFDQMDQGKTSWNAPMLDTTVSGCFDRMTIASTNPCALEWLRQVGRENMNSYVYSLGFSHGTSFTRPDATHTTANDLLKMMIGLNNGSIISGAHRDRLLHSLSVHPYRYGVPTGSQGQVWDKVGFLWDYVHDAAIVRHPKGTYVIVVMTKGQSYWRIAEITREVEKIMYP
jgi:hypothetical protein